MHVARSDISYRALELLSFELLANLAAVADVLVLNVHKTSSKL